MDSLTSDWETLADAVKAPPFLRPGWFELWWRAFGTGETRLLSVRKGDILVGVMPLVQRGRSLASMANDHTPGFDPLVQNDDAALELSRALLAHRPRRVVLEYVKAKGPGLRSVREAAGAAGYRLVIRDWERPPFVALDGDWESYGRSLDGKLRRDLARRARRLAEEGAVTSRSETVPTTSTSYWKRGSPSSSPDGKPRVALRSSRGLRHEILRGSGALGSESWNPQAVVPPARQTTARVPVRPRGHRRLLLRQGRLRSGVRPLRADEAPAATMLESSSRTDSSGSSSSGPPEPFKLEWTSTCHDLKRVELFDRSARHGVMGCGCVCAAGGKEGESVHPTVRRHLQR